MISTAVVILASLVAQPLAPSVPGAGGPGGVAASERVAVSAIQARNTGEPFMDPALRGLAPALEGLPFDTYRQLFTTVQAAEYGEVSTFPIDDVYTLHASLSPQPQGEMVGLEVIVQMRQDGPPVNAVVASGLVPRDQPVVFQGLENRGGQLVLVVSIPPPQQPESQSQDQNQDQQNDQNEEGDEEQQQPPPEQPEADSQQDQQQPQQPQDLSRDELQNLEAILESLKEQDRDEQKDMHNQRARVVVQGDWW